MCQGNTIGPVQVIIGEFLDYLTILSDLSSWWNFVHYFIYMYYIYINIVFLRLFDTKKFQESVYYIWQLN